MSLLSYQLQSYHFSISLTSSLTISHATCPMDVASTTTRLICMTHAIIEWKGQKELYRSFGFQLFCPCQKVMQPEFWPNLQMFLCIYAWSSHLIWVIGLVQIKGISSCLLMVLASGNMFKIMHIQQNLATKWRCVQKLASASGIVEMYD